MRVMCKLSDIGFRGPGHHGCGNLSPTDTEGTRFVEGGQVHSLPHCLLLSACQRRLPLTVRPQNHLQVPQPAALSDKPDSRGSGASVNSQYI